MCPGMCHWCAIAGALEPFEIYVWSLRTGMLLDAIAGHDGPVVALRIAARLHAARALVDELLHPCTSQLHDDLVLSC